MKILCPTDMSDHSVVALKYAVNMANDLDAELHIISAYQVSKGASGLVSIADKVKNCTEEDLEKVVSEILPLIKNDEPPITNVYRGSSVNTILKYADKNAIDLIIMGTQGDNSMRTILFGSVTKKVARQSKIPVLAIPQDVETKLQSNKILFAIDSGEIKSDAKFAVPKKIATDLGLRIDLLHIQRPNEDFPFDPFISGYLGNLLGEVILIDGKDPIFEIKKYAEEHNVGMVIMLRREKSFFQKLFFSGNTNEEIAKTNTPLMIIPE